MYKLLPVLLCVVLGLLALACQHILRAFKSKFRPHGFFLPPGTYGWPIIGETLKRQRVGQLGKPEEFVLSRMLQYSKDIFKTSLFLESVAIVCGPMGNKFLFSNENKYVTVWWTHSLQNVFPSSILKYSGPNAKSVRKLLTTFLKPEALQRYVGIMDSITQYHISTAWEGKHELKFLPLSKHYTFLLTSRIFASIQDPDLAMKLVDKFQVLCDGVIQIPFNFPGTRYYRAMKAADVVRKELSSIIKQRRMALSEGMVSPTQDLLTGLLTTADENGRFMTEKEITDNILLLLFAGHDTISGTLTMLVKYLAQMPHIYDKVLREQMEIARSKGPEGLLDWKDVQKMKYSWNVVCEVLRISPSVEGNFREAIADFNYAGFDIPKGWKLFWSMYSTHKNPDYFPEPEKFDPSRFEGEGPAPYTFVPFGGGPRMCPGNEYVRLKVLVFLHNVVKRFRWELVFPDELVKVDPLPAPEKGLPIRLQPHQA